MTHKGSVSANPRGTNLARFVRLLAVNEGHPYPAAQDAERLYVDSPAVGYALRAIVEASDTSSASALTTYGISGEFLELLRERSAVQRLRDRMFQVLPRVATPLETTAPVAAWVGEAGALPAGRATLGSVTAELYKFGLIVPLSRELVQRSSPIAELVIRRILTNAVGRFIDEQFLNSSISLVAGIRPASITNNATSHTSTGSTTSAISSDLGAMVSALDSWGDAAWIMRQETLSFIASRNTGFLHFAGTQPILLGLPVYVTPATLNQVTLVDLSAIALSDPPDGLEIEGSSEATIEMDTDPQVGESSPVSSISTLKSFYQNNLIGIKCIRQIGWERPISNSVVYMVTSY